MLEVFMELVREHPRRDGLAIPVREASLSGTGERAPPVIW